MSKVIVLYLLTLFSHTFTIYRMATDSNTIVICGSIIFIGSLLYMACKM